MINTDPEHIHSYDTHGNMTCCSLDEKVYHQAHAEDVYDGHGAGHEEHSHAAGPAGMRTYVPVFASFVLLLSGIIFDEWLQPSFFGPVRLFWYLGAYVLVGGPVIRDAWKSIVRGEVFTEFFLMTLATLGAFYIGEFAEAAAVMLFYAIGELFQSAAVNRAKRQVRSMLDIRPNKVTVIRHRYMEVKPDTVQIGELILVRAGERVALDGTLVGPPASLNPSALTGESMPMEVGEGMAVLAGLINLGQPIRIRVTHKYAESTLARILEMVQHANSRKAPTELFIRKFARVYTPVVVLLALLLLLVPILLAQPYVFNDWLYRAMVFLVISCPCALVVSIPLGYFGGIGAASRQGILVKGSQYLDLVTRVKVMVLDKTGTLTKGIFRVQEIKPQKLSREAFVLIVASVEAQSTHPVARAIVRHIGSVTLLPAENTEEVAGMGLKARVNGAVVLAGSTKILKKFSIPYPAELDTLDDTLVVAAVDDAYAGYITVADEIKPDAIKTVKALHDLHIHTVILSGDKQTVVDKVAQTLGVQSAIGNLLPADKAGEVESLRHGKSAIAFVGDGINDALVLAVSDVGIAMGGVGSDAAIETADIVIQTDRPWRIVTTIHIARATRAIVWQNIGLAMGVKAVVLLLGAGGMATLWEAVFADVGVALLAILNAVRIQYKKFD